MRNTLDRPTLEPSPPPMGQVNKVRCPLSQIGQGQWHPPVNGVLFAILQHLVGT